jgi:hypothetical protein
MASKNKGAKNKPQQSPPNEGKVGSDPEAIHQFGGKHDFGVPADDRHTVEREYVSENTKASDPGAAQPASSEFEGNRTHGAGGKATGDGSSSGGDLDPDLIGVGTGGSGVADNPAKFDRPGADDTEGSSSDMASGPPAKGENQTGVGKIGGPIGEPHRGDATVNPEGDITTQGPGDAAANMEHEQADAFPGEVSFHEAEGEDNPEGQDNPADQPPD